MIQSLNLIVLTNQAQAFVEVPISACNARFENTDTGTHGWAFSDRSDYALGVGTIDCLNLTVAPASITVHAEISAIDGVGFAGSKPDIDTKVCVDARKCSTERIESNGGPKYEGETCFEWSVEGSTSLEGEGSARVVEPRMDKICAT